MNDQLIKDFPGEKTGFVQVGPEKYFYQNKYLNLANKYYNFESKLNDTWIVALPRSGTTWTQELIWMVANNFDYELAQKIPLSERVSFFEISMCQQKTPANVVDIKDEIFFGNCSKSPRFIKTHFPFSLLPPSVMENKSKIIYVARNPKDVAVSFYYFSKSSYTFGYNGDFRNYWKYFKNNLVVWTPYWAHVKEGWSHRNDPNVLFLFYEDMTNNLPDVIKKVANFLNKSITVEQIKILANYLHIDNFRQNPSVNLSHIKNNTNASEHEFIRKGKTEGWKDEFSNELNSEADCWIELNCQNTDLQFPNDPNKIY